MTMKLQVRAALAATCIAMAMVAAPTRAAEIPMVTGEQWTKSSDAEKKAYLLGMANIVQVDNAVQAANAPKVAPKHPPKNPPKSAQNDAQTFLPRLSKGMEGQTLDSVRQNLDSWYAANPERLKRPVIDIIWFEMAVPGLQKNK